MIYDVSKYVLSSIKTERIFFSVFMLYYSKTNKMSHICKISCHSEEAKKKRYPELTSEVCLAVEKFSLSPIAYKLVPYMYDLELGEKLEQLKKPFLKDVRKLFCLILILKSLFTYI